MIAGHIRSLAKNEVAVGSMILIAFVFIGNVFSYLFQTIMARVLGPEQYSILAVVTSIIAIFLISTNSIQTLVAKHTTSLKVHGEIGKIHGLMNYLIKKMLKISVVVFLIFLAVSLFLVNYLKIEYGIFFVTGLFIFFSFTYPILTGILQGMKNFKLFGVSFMLNCLLKLIMGIILVSLLSEKFRIYGATSSFVIGAALAYLITLFFIKDIRKQPAKEEKISLISKNNLHIIVSMLILVLIYSLDIIFVKAFFPSITAGKYAVLSNIGKIILLINASIGIAMFPINAEKFLKGDSTRNVIRKTVGLVFFVSLILTMLFLFFPDKIIFILFGGQYTDLSPLLVYIGIAFSFISFLNIQVLYELSLDRFKNIHQLFLIGFLIAEIIVFSVFKETIAQFSIAFMWFSIISFAMFYLITRK